MSHHEYNIITIDVVRHILDRLNYLADFSLRLSITWDAETLGSLDYRRLNEVGTQVTRCYADVMEIARKMGIT